MQLRLRLSWYSVLCHVQPTMATYLDELRTSDVDRVSWGGTIMLWYYCSIGVSINRQCNRLNGWSRYSEQTAGSSFLPNSSNGRCTLSFVKYLELCPPIYRGSVFFHAPWEIARNGYSVKLRGFTFAVQNKSSRSADPNSVTYYYII